MNGAEIVFAVLHEVDRAETLVQIYDNEIEARERVRLEESLLPTGEEWWIEKLKVVRIGNHFYEVD